jgi:hypothetical protein
LAVYLWLRIAPGLAAFSRPRRGRSSHVSSARAVAVATTRLRSTLSRLALTAATLLALAATGLASTTAIAATGLARSAALAAAITSTVPVSPRFAAGPALPLSPFGWGHECC